MRVHRAHLQHALRHRRLPCSDRRPGTAATLFNEVVRDGAVFASITSEPGSSFRDKLAIRTSIRRENGRYRLNGTKHFCSLSTGATYYFTWSLLDGATDLTDGLLNVLIRADQPGVEIIHDWDTIGMRGTVSNSIRFHDVEILPENVIGAPGAILGKDMSIWSLGYTGVYFGIAEAAYEFCLEYVKKTKFRGMSDSLAFDARIQRQIGEMATLLESARRAVEQLVWCLTNTLTNLRVLLAVGCVALPRVVHATARPERSAAKSKDALPTTKMPSHLHNRICETPH